MGLPLRLRPSQDGRGLLIGVGKSGCRNAFSLALSHFARQVGTGACKRVLLVLDRAGFHTGGEVMVPEGGRARVPTRSLAGVAAGREAVAFGQREGGQPTLGGPRRDGGGALVERCLVLSKQPELLRRGSTSYHWWPKAA